MRSFWHFKLDEGTAARALSPLLLFTENVTLWCPSVKIIRQRYEQGLLRYSPEQILTLIELGHIRVAGRREWFENGPKRTHAAQLYDWAEVEPWFDGRIRDILNSIGEPNSGRVIGLGDEQGNDFAAEEMEKANSQIARFSRDCILCGTYPSSSRYQEIIEKFDGEKRTRELTQLFMRDSKNNSDAMVAIGADISATTDLTIARAMAFISGQSSVVHAPEHQQRVAVLEEAIDLGRSLAGKESFDDIIRLREDPEQMRLIDSLLRSKPGEVRSALASQIDQGIPKENAWTDYLGSSQADKAVTVGGAALTAYAALNLGTEAINAYNKQVKSISRREIGLAAIGFVLAGFHPVKTYAERSNLAEDSRYGSTQWPFIFANGHNASNAELEPMKMQIEYGNG